VGYPELLRVLGEEAAREARDVGAAAEREEVRILAEAREAARTAYGALLARERGEREARLRTARESLSLERERVLLVERRRQLDGLRAEILRRLPAAGSPELDARFLAEILPEAGEGPIEVVVDPGAEQAARDALARIAPEVSRRATVRASPAARGGVEVVAGPRVLDDTLPARLELAWPDLEAELAAILFGEA
jgi:V/A-type H+-transporting ATPase subunit E